MKTIAIRFLSAVILLGAFYQILPEDRVHEESPAGRIDSVIVFSDRALVRRIYKTGGGDTTLRIRDLPASVLADSFRASASAGLTVHSVAVKADSAPDDHPLRARLEKIQSDLRAESDRNQSYQEQLKLLGSFAALSTAGTDKEARAGAIRVDGWNDAVRFLEEKRLFYREAIRKSDVRRAELQKEENRVREQMQRSAGRRAAFVVEVAASGRGEITLEYIVTGVAWRTVYDLRGSSDGGDFALESQAVVRQSTGEDWNQVKVSLSTARPAAGTSPGALRPWRVTTRALSMPDSDDRKNEAQSNRNEEDGQPSSGSSDTGDSSSFTADLPRRETIAADNADHRVSLARADLKGTVTHVAIPSVSSYVYLRARIRNSGNFPLLGGSMNLFVDGMFVGSTNAPRAAVGSEFDVYLGADQRMQIRRTLLKGDIADAGILSKKVAIENQWQIEVANYTKKARHVIVLDQFPVPADPGLSTKFIGSSRSDVSADANGILTWKMELKPGESQKFDFSYNLELPREAWDRLMAVNKQPATGKGRAQDALEENAPEKPRKMYNIEQMLSK